MRITHDYDNIGVQPEEESSFAEQMQERDYLDKGSVFAMYKWRFIVLGLFALSFIVLFMLYAFDVVPLWLVDAIIVPILLIVLLMYYKNRSGGTTL